MSTEDFGQDIVIDLLRSAWLVDAARTDIYSRWAAEDAKYAEYEDRARRRARLIEETLSETGGKTDPDLVDPHAGWMRSMIGEGPKDMALSDIFLIRLGDWVQAHATLFFSDGKDEYESLANQDKQGLEFPSSLPEPPPYEPLQIPQVEAPGEVLFRFGILGDMHVGSERADAMTEAAVKELNESGAEIVVQLGDLTDTGAREEFETASKILKKLEMPYATMMGNHDVLSRSEQRLSGRDYYPTSFGREPDGVLLEHKDFRFAVLDSAEHGASPFAPFDLLTGGFTEGPGGAVVRGSLSVPQHEILADLAAPDSGPAFVFLHHPPQPFVSFPPVIFGLRDEDSGRLHAVCDSGNVWGVFAGHTHRNKRPRMYGDVPVQEVGIPRDYPFGYALVEVTKEGYCYRFVQLSDEDLVRPAAEQTGELFRRYAEGSGADVAYTWTH
jgi:3',5'-cyclic AMP phosphodiesterase CpdA